MSSLFYFVLHTIEDDMTILDAISNYDGCDSNENDHQLLVVYDVVVEEVTTSLPGPGIG